MNCAHKNLWGTNNFDFSFSKKWFRLFSFEIEFLEVYYNFIEADCTIYNLQSQCYMLSSWYWLDHGLDFKYMQ